ncbi:polyamine oxidase 7-like [Dendronephthya gigantea]|uniref:polyamine oxidase 7-like n=1 Tax=Dendronephthya gigantea TaxID=151771 RepID=UPI00106D2152|nr:polyamine oxidase 7-like [Dendronephthya gigantea]
MGVFSYVRCNFLLVFYGILLTCPTVCFAVTEVDVLILGAGISGITAGSYLQSNGQSNFLILEAQDYIGGRVKQVKIGGLTVGEGANWVHYVEDGDENPILVIANKINLMRYSMNISDFTLRNSIHQNDDLGKAYKTVEELGMKLTEQNENNAQLSGDEPLSSVFAQHGWIPDTALKRTAEWWYLDFEYSVKPALASFRQFSGIPLENEYITDNRGFKGIIDYLSQNITGKFKTEKVVTHIKLNTSNGIEVRTRDGETFKAKYALCTFSTGVLASDLVTFEPELPKWKKVAISRLPLAYYTNIYVKFPSAFWDDTEFILNAGSLTETFPLVYNLNIKDFHRGSNVLLFSATGENSLRIEAQSKNATKAEVMKSLREMYPNVNIPEPLEMTVGSFSQNPYIRGSFSNAAVGVTSADFNNLQGRLGNLFFSGEATSENYWGYSQAGYSGSLKQAKVIHSCLNGGECPAYEPEIASICKNKNIVPSSASIGLYSPAFFILIILFMLFN